MGIATDMKRIADDIVTAYDMRVKALGDIVVDTRRTMKGFTSNRKKMANEQAEDLHEFTKELVKDVKGKLKGFQGELQKMSGDRIKMAGELKEKLAKEVKDIKTDTKKRLKEFSQAHADMSEDLKKDLSKFTGDITSEVKGILNNAQKFVRECGSDMKEAKETWQGMTSNMAKFKAGGIMPRIEAGEKFGTVEEFTTKKKGKTKGGKKKRKR